MVQSPLTLCDTILQCPIGAGKQREVMLLNDVQPWASKSHLTEDATTLQQLTPHLQESCHLSRGMELHVESQLLLAIYKLACCLYHMTSS